MGTNKAIHAHQTVIRHIAMDLRSMADAAHIMGQDRLSDALISCASEMEISCQDVARAYSAELSRNLTDAQRGLGDTLMALIDAASPASQNKEG